MKCFWAFPGARYMFFHRLCVWLKTQGIIYRPFYFITRIIHKHYQYKFGIFIPYNTEIGEGFYIGHCGGIVVNSTARIGKNCNINHGVTIGTKYGGKNPGTPTILNNVYIGPGAKIIGGITVGNNVAIGANCVVTRSVPTNGVVVGVPGKIVSYNGAANYIVNTVEELSKTIHDFPNPESTNSVSAT